MFRAGCMLRLADGVLRASNTGAVLDAGGVASLSSLRASAKRDDAASIGRFGVGFAAVLAVTDEPAIASSTGAVRWSDESARDAVEARSAVDGAGLADELARRRGHLPALRLPFPADDQPDEGFATTVILPLRDAAAESLVRSLLDDVDDALLLAMPALTEIVVEADGARRVVEGVERWHAVRREGRLDPALLAGRPTEERDRPWWSLCWALPNAGQPVPATVHAPTPTDEPLDLPALLVCSFPLDPTRRHVAPGPLTDFLVGRAAEAYVELATGAADPVALVPGPVPAGALDAALRSAVVAALADAPLLEARDGRRVRPRDAVSVIGADGRLRTVLAPVLDPLVPDARALDRLGTRRLTLADVVDRLVELDREPSWWHGLYDALAGLPESGDVLAALPVPLADGRLVRGPRGLLQPVIPLPPGLEPLGLRVVHPQAAHPLLVRAGALEADARTVLEDPAVRAVVEADGDDGEAGEVAEAVLGLVAAAHLRVGELPWLGDLLLEDEEGEPAPARDLVLPGSPVEQVAETDALARPAPALLDRWDDDVLAAVGVVTTFSTLVDTDVSLDDCDHDLDDEDGWVRDAFDGLPGEDMPPVLPELVAVRDLDVVRDDAWPQVLGWLAADPALRAAVIEPARLLLGGGRSAETTSYTAWWLRRHARIDGKPPTDLSTPADPLLAGLFDVVRTDVDDAFLRALGVRTSLPALLAERGGAEDLLARLADESRPVTAAALSELYDALARVDPDDVEPPSRVRVAPDHVVAADDALVVDVPSHLQLRWPTPPLVVGLSGASALAEVLDLALTSSRVPATAVPGGTAQPVPASAHELVDGLPEQWWEHDDLVVAGTPVEWWTGPDGAVHACTRDGLARGLAWSSGRWELRLLLAAALADPGRVAELDAERRLEDPRRSS